MANGRTTTSKSAQQVRFPNESAEYRRARDILRKAEIALRRQIEAVAQLPQAGIESVAYVPGPYSNQEGLLYEFDQHYLGALDAPLDA